MNKIMTDHNKNIIEVEDVSFGYNEKLVVNNADLVIHEGDYLGIIGPNGGGKSTLIKLILGILKPRSGLIKIFGKPANEFKERYKIGYLAQKATDVDISFPITVNEVVSMGRFSKAGLFHGLSKIDKEKIDKALVEVDIVDLKDRLIGNLSGGQEQKVFIARALAQEPEVIFLDEPTSGIDEKSKIEFYKLLKRLNQELKITLVLISHDIDVVTEEVTEIAAINEEIVYYGSAKQFRKEEHHDKLYVKGLEFIRHDHH